MSSHAPSGTCGSYKYHDMRDNYPETYKVLMARHEKKQKKPKKLEPKVLSPEEQEEAELEAKKTTLLHRDGVGGKRNQIGNFTLDGQ